MKPWVRGSAGPQRINSLPLAPNPLLVLRGVDVDVEKVDEFLPSESGDEVFGGSDDLFHEVDLGANELVDSFFDGAASEEFEDLDEAPLSDAVETLEKLKEQGKILAGGKFGVILKDTGMRLSMLDFATKFTQYCLAREGYLKFVYDLVLWVHYLKPRSQRLP